MAKRMWKQSFTSYVFLLAVPTILLGLWLAVHPQTLLPIFLNGDLTALSGDTAAPENASADAGAEPGSLTPDLKYIARLAGLGLFLVSMLLFTARRQPSQNRDFMFWISLYFAGLAGLNFAAAFFGEISLWTLPAGIYWAIAAGFLMAFASRYLLVRE